MNYQKIYQDLISRAQNANRVKNYIEYYEVHHIIPRTLGGTGKLHEWRTHPNLVLLTAKEHFIAHLLLVQMYPKNSYEYNKMLHALSFFLAAGKNHRRYKITSRTYERLKLEIAELKKGVSRSEETKQKIRETKKQNPWQPTKEFRKQCSERNKGSKNAMYGKTHSVEAREKISKARKGKPNPTTSRNNKNRKGKKLTYTREVEQYSQENIFIASYVSVAEAKRQTGVGPIHLAAKGIQKTAGGFIWRYKNI